MRPRAVSWEFVDAALEYCELWTTDARNVHNARAFARSLERARGRLYDAYREIKRGKSMYPCKGCGVEIPAYNGRCENCMNAERDGEQVPAPEQASEAPAPEKPKRGRPPKKKPS